MREEELNRKLWYWLGKKPEGDFITDLSLCFKWLVPAWNKESRPIASWIKSIAFTFIASHEFSCRIQRFSVHDFFWRGAETPEKAFCGAFKTLIELSDELPTVFTPSLMGGDNG